jgi:hypothetical protein
VILFVAVRSSEPVASGDSTTPTVETPTPSVATPEKPKGTGKVELQDVRFFTQRGVPKIVYVVGELVNVGTSSINAPRAKITVFDGSKTALDSTTCGEFVVRDLQPKEKVPCFSVMTKAEGWKTYQIETEFSESFFESRAADLKISDVESTSPASSYGAHKVEGKITNNSTFTAKNVWIVVGLYDDGGKIVGAGKTMVAGNDLAPGASGKFSVSIYSVAAKPTKSITKVFGYDR